MKRILPGITVLALTSMLFLTACVSVNFDTVDRDTVLGEGPVVSQSYDVPSYTSVELTGDFRLHYSNEPSDTITVELNENLVPLLTVDNADGRLRIGFDRRVRTPNGESPILHLSTQDFQELIVHGSLVWDTADKVEGESFSLDVSGACVVDLDVDVQALSTDVSGAGTMELRGNAHTANISISGASTIEALELETVNAYVDMSGTGTGNISCSGVLDVEISGMGSFEYRGDCTVNPNISGAGTVKKIQ